MVAATPVLLIVFGLALATFCTLSLVFLVQKDQFQKEIDEAYKKLKSFEQKNNASYQNVDNADARYADARYADALDTDTKDNMASDIPKMAYWPSNRLPRDVWPLKYDLNIILDMSSGEINGHVSIQIKVLQRTNRIIIHSSHLNIMDTLLMDECNTEISTETEIDFTNEFLIIHAQKMFKKGVILNLDIVFAGEMGEILAGMFLLESIENKTFLATNFQPGYARTVFPCFDEPDYKAIFQITFQHTRYGNSFAISTMNTLGSKQVKHMYRNEFEESVMMSPHQLSFIITDFKYKEVYIDTNGIGNPFFLRIYASKLQIDNLEYSLSVAKDILEYYIQYFQVAYPLPKLDMIAFPNFPVPLVENWGLIQFSEDVLAYTPDTNFTINKEVTINEIAQTFAKMWIGNLVTPKWWNELWLCEGFSTFLQLKALNAVFENMSMEEEYILDNFHSILIIDSKPLSLPLIIPSNSQLPDLFQEIIRNKGSAILFMIEDYIGSENFQRVITSFITKYKYQNANTNDFFNEFEILNLNFTMRDVMQTWTEQKGYPVVNVHQISETEYNLTQTRFFENIDDYEMFYQDSPFGFTWSIPITYRTSDNNAKNEILFHHNMKSAIIQLTSPVDWIKLNVWQNGYYRVNYDAELWKKLFASFHTEPSEDQLSYADDIGLINDAFTLAIAEQLDYKILAIAIETLAKGVYHPALVAGINGLLRLRDKFLNTEFDPVLQTIAQMLLTKTYNEKDWTVGDSDFDNRYLRKILKLACDVGLEECLTEASYQLETFIENPEVRPNPDIREIVYCYGIKATNDEEIWESVYILYFFEKDPNEKLMLRKALSFTENPVLISRLLDRAWDISVVSNIDYINFLIEVSNNPISNYWLWKYVRNGWVNLVRRFGQDHWGLGALIFAITEKFNSQTQLGEMEDFFEKRPMKGFAQQAIQFAFENVKNNINWLERNKGFMSEISLSKI